MIEELAHKILDNGYDGEGVEDIIDAVEWLYMDHVAYCHSMNVLYGVHEEVIPFTEGLVLLRDLPANVRHKVMSRLEKNNDRKYETFLDEVWKSLDEDTKRKKNKKIAS